MPATVTSVQDNAGLIEARKVRQTGLVVSLYDSIKQGIADGTDQDRYATVCEDHGGVIVHATLTLARMSLPYPREWCPDCSGETFDPHGPKESTR